MKAELKVLELTHDELVNILSTATYGSQNLMIDVPNEWKHLNKGKCLEDGWANVLLNGGCLDITDCQSEEEKDNYEAYGHNYVSTRWEQYEGWNGEWGVVVYRVNLQNFLNGCSTKEGIGYLTELLSGQGDYYTAYNLMQMILFEEVIYG